MNKYFVRNNVTGVVTLVTAESESAAVAAVATGVFSIMPADDAVIVSHRYNRGPEIDLTPTQALTPFVFPVSPPMPPGVVPEPVSPLQGFTEPPAV